MKPIKLGSAVLLSAALGSLTLPALAQQQTISGRDNGFSYTYLQGGYEVGDIANPEADVDALFFEGSYAFDPNLFLRGGVNFYDGELDGRFSPDVDGERIHLGLGFNTLLQENLDLVVTGDVVRVRADVDGGRSDSETGYALGAGLRHRTTDKIELSGGAFHEDVEDSDTGLYGQALYKLQPQVDLGARVAVGGDTGTFGLFGRYNF